MSEESANEPPHEAPKVPPVAMPKMSRLGALLGAFRVKTNPGVSKFEHLVLGATFKSTHTRVASLEQDANLMALYRDTCAKAGMTPGKLLVVDSPIPNAVYMMNGTMAVSTGLQHLLDPQETQGVIAHELGHRRHAFKHLWSGLALGVALMAAAYIPVRKLGDYLAPGRSAHMDGSHLSDRLRRMVATGGDMMKSLVVGFTAAGLVLRGRSQKNELEADDESVRITGNADALISGLQKVEKRAIEIKLAHLRGNTDYLEEKAATHPAAVPPQPLEDAELRQQGYHAARRGDAVAAQNGTHPPMPERTARLEAQSFQQRYEQEQALSALASVSRV